MPTEPFHPPGIVVEIVDTKIVTKANCARSTSTAEGWWQGTWWCALERCRLWLRAKRRRQLLLCGWWMGLIAAMFVVSCITVLYMCVWRTRCVSTIVCAKWWIACALPLRGNSENFVKCWNKILEKPTDGLMYGECQLEDIWRWVCWDKVNGHGSCKSHQIDKSVKPALP